LVSGEASGAGAVGARRFESDFDPRRSPVDGGNGGGVESRATDSRGDGDSDFGAGFGSDSVTGFD
jgi:hypothetical protein